MQDCISLINPQINLISMWKIMRAGKLAELGCHYPVPLVFQATSWQYSKIFFIKKSIVIKNSIGMF